MLCFRHLYSPLHKYVKNILMLHLRSMKLFLCMHVCNVFQTETLTIPGGDSL